LLLVFDRAKGEARDSIVADVVVRDIIKERLIITANASNADTVKAWVISGCKQIHNFETDTLKYAIKDCIYFTQHK
jgi:hypothetical protein